MVEKLVTADWVQQHKSDPDVRLVEVDVDTEAYKDGHIEGTVAWNWTTQLQDPVRRTILDQAAMEALLSKAGITPDTHVILYGDNNNWFAAYALWLLEMYGHTNVSLMDGGRVKWLGDQRPMTTAEPKVAATAYLAKAADGAPRAKREEVLAAPGERRAVGGRAVARGVLGRRDRASGDDGDGATGRPHPRREKHPVGARGERRRHVPLEGRTAGALRRPGP